MKIELELLDAKKSQEFLKYFIAQLKEKDGMPILLCNATAGFNEYNQYETLLEDTVPTNDNQTMMIDWKIIQNIDGTIPYIEAVSKSNISIENCSKHLYTFVQKVQTLTLSETKKEFFNRQYYCYINSSNLMGEYWLGSKIRIAPLYPNDEKLMNAERILVIDQLIEAIDQAHANQLAEEQADIISAQLSFLLDIGLYRPSMEERWIIHKDETTSEITNKRVRLGVWDFNSKREMPKKGEKSSLAKPEKSIFDIERFAFYDLNFPTETRKIFKALNQTDYQNKLAFEKACRLYRIALDLGRYHPTIGLSYMYGAIDSITQTTKKESGFSEFVRKYVTGVDNTLLETIHSKIRSAHWHGGEFYMGENESRMKDYMLNPTESIRFNISTEATRIMRLAILNWLFTEVVK